MAQQILNNGESGLIIRNKINDNFTELYDGDGKFVYPENYGAVGDGSTNDQAAIQSAVDSGFPVFFSKKNYRVNSTITVPAGTYLLGSGTESIISTTSNIPIITINGVNVTIKNISFDGNDTGTSQVGIYAVGDNPIVSLLRHGLYVEGCSFTDFGGSGFYGSNIMGDGSSNHKGVTFIGNKFYSNRYGIDLFYQCEYGLYMGNTIVNNTRGITMGSAGNNSLVGNNINDNTIGLYMEGPGNDGHCVSSGNKYNHNTTSVSLLNMGLGYLFIGDMFYGSPMIINNSTNIKFVSCDISAPTITVTNATALKFFECRFYVTPTFTVTGSNPIFFNNTWDSGTVPSIVDNTIVGKFSTSNVTTVGGSLTSTASTDAMLKVNPTITGSSTNTINAVGGYVSPTLIISANNQRSIGVHINPTFTNGAFTGSTNISQWIQGSSVGYPLVVSSGGTNSSSHAFLAENSTGAQLFKIRSDGPVFFGSSLTIGQYNPTYTVESPTANQYLITQNLTPDAAGTGIRLRTSATVSSTASDRVALGVTGFTIAPTSGTATFGIFDIKGVVNQTGTASGAIRVLDVSPTYTSVLGTIIGIDYNPTVTLVSGAHIALRATSGSVLIGGTTLTTSAILDLQSTTKAFIPPRMTTTEKNAIASPSNGMVVYDLTLGKLCVRGASAWETVTSV